MRTCGAPSQKIEQEAETRAVAYVSVHNITPVPAAAGPEEVVREWRKEGQQYRYVFTKTGEGWKIEDVQRWEYDTESRKETRVRASEIDSYVKPKASIPLTTYALY